MVWLLHHPSLFTMWSHNTSTPTCTYDYVVNIIVMYFLQGCPTCLYGSVILSLSFYYVLLMLCTCACALCYIFLFFYSPSFYYQLAFFVFTSHFLSSSSSSFLFLDLVFLLTLFCLLHLFSYSPPSLPPLLSLLILI